jgi:hypothetical protein
MTMNSKWKGGDFMNKTTKILLIVAVIVVIAAVGYGIHHMLYPTDMPM